MDPPHAVVPSLNVHGCDIIDDVSICFLLSLTFLEREEEAKAKEEQERKDKASGGAQAPQGSVFPLVFPPRQEGGGRKGSENFLFRLWTSL